MGFSLGMGLGLTRARIAFGPELVTNGGFDSDTGWVKGIGWTIGSGVASCDGSQVAVSSIDQNVGAQAGVTYRITVTVSGLSVGFITALRIGGAEDGTNLIADGTYFSDVTAVDVTDFKIKANSTFVGSIDKVSCKVVL